jgi:DNA replication protein DnaC
MTSIAAMTNPNPENTDLAARLHRLGFKAIADSLDDFLARAIKGQWSPRTLLEELERIENQDRARRSLDRRLQHSRIGRFKPMADFDWNWPKKIDRDTVQRALTLDFIPEARNLILVGANGLGKTMIAKNIAHAAVLAGYSVLFRTASELLDDLQCDSPHRLRLKLRAYARPALLCIDECGYLAYDNHAADLLYEVVNRRYERRSILVTTNRSFREWDEVFPNATSIATLLDRLTHHADVTVLEGQSYRVHESEQEAAKRRRKKKR